MQETGHSRVGQQGKAEAHYCMKVVQGRPSQGQA